MLTIFLKNHLLKQVQDLSEARAALEEALKVAQAETAAAGSAAPTDITEDVMVPEANVDEGEAAAAAEATVDITDAAATSSTANEAAKNSVVFPTAAEPSAPPWDIEDEPAPAPAQPIESLPPPPAYDDLLSYDEVATTPALTTGSTSESYHFSSSDSGSSNALPPPPPFEEVATAKSRSRNGSLVSAAASDDAEFMDADAFVGEGFDNNDPPPDDSRDNRGDRSGSTVDHAGGERVSTERVTELEQGGDDALAALQGALAEAEERAEAAEDAQRHSESLVASMKAELAEAKEVAEALGSVVSSLEGQQQQQNQTEQQEGQKENGGSSDFENKNESSGESRCSSSSCTDAEAALAAAWERVSLLEAELEDLKASASSANASAASTAKYESGESKANVDDAAASTISVAVTDKSAQKPLDGTVWLHYKHQGEAHPMRYVGTK